MMRFNFTVSNVPKKKVVIADTLYDAPAESPSDSAQSQAFVNAVLHSIAENTTNQRKSAKRQRLYSKMSFCQSEWLDKVSLPIEIQPHYLVMAKLSVENGLLIRSCCIVILSELQSEMQLITQTQLLYIATMFSPVAHLTCSYIVKSTQMRTFEHLPVNSYK